MNCSWCDKPLSGKQTQFCSTACKNITWNKGKRERYKRQAVELLGGRCEVCGYHKCLAALSFHHKEPGKEKGLSWSHSSWQRLLAELPKCRLLCANCHMEEHYTNS